MDYQIAQARSLSRSKNWEAYEPEKLTAYPAFSLRPSVALRLDASLRLSTTALVGEVNLRVACQIQSAPDPYVYPVRTRYTCIYINYSILTACGSIGYILLPLVAFANPKSSGGRGRETATTASRSNRSAILSNL